MPVSYQDMHAVYHYYNMHRYARNRDKIIN